MIFCGEKLFELDFSFFIINHVSDINDITNRIFFKCEKLDKLSINKLFFKNLIIIKYKLFYNMKNNNYNLNRIL